MKEYLVSDLPRRFFSSDDRETRLNEFISYCLDKALIEAINKIQIFKDCPPSINGTDIINNGDGTVTLRAPLYMFQLWAELEVLFYFLQQIFL